MLVLMSYAGDVTPHEAYAALEQEPEAVLVDVRTAAEWAYVGMPDLAGLQKRVVAIEWQTYPDGERNGAFLGELRAAGVGPGTPVYFLCRSGFRSAAAAALVTDEGLGPAYNISQGFEGPTDEQGHRSIAGWKVDGLPWRQG